MPPRFALRSLAHDAGPAYFDPAVINSLAVITVGIVLLVALAVVVAARRRGKPITPFELGTVSQQWLVGHKGDER